VARLIALLRGVNVGGNRKVAMADLRACFAEAGCSDVATYIQSGNVVFEPPPGAGGDGLRADLERRIADTFGFEVPALVRSGEEMRRVVDGLPFRDTDASSVHVAFLPDAPGQGALDGFDASAFAPEALVLDGREVYLFLPEGMGRAKLPPALPLLRRVATVRNWRTVTTLAGMAGSDG